MSRNITHILIVCDTYDYEDYAVHVHDDEDVERKKDYYDGRNMQRVDEIKVIDPPVVCASWCKDGKPYSAEGPSIRFNLEDHVKSGNRRGIVTGIVSNISVRVYWYSGADMYHETVDASTLEADTK